MKKKILALKKGKRKMSVNIWQTWVEMQNKLKGNEYILFWNVAGKEVWYIDKGNMLTGSMTEKVFDTIDKGKIYGTI